MASEYHRGEMDISEHKATYAAVMALTKWGSLALAASLLTLTIWFCTPAGFASGFISGLFGGLIPGVVLTVLGIIFLREKKGGGH